MALRHFPVLDSVQREGIATLALLCDNCGSDVLALIVVRCARSFLRVFWSRSLILLWMFSGSGGKRHRDGQTVATPSRVGRRRLAGGHC